MKTNRIGWIDSAKAIGIYLVVLGHCYPTGWPSPQPRHLIYLFHMPLFFFLSGCTFKPASTLRDGVIKDFYRLMLPAFSWTFVYLIVGALRKAINSGWDAFCPCIYEGVHNFFTSFVYKQYWIGSATWFLFVLFWCKLLLGVCLKLKNVIVSFLVWSTLFVLVMFTSRHSWLANIVVAFPFLVGGLFVMRYKITSATYISWLLRPALFGIIAIAAIALMSSSKYWYGTSSLLGPVFGQHNLPFHLNYVVFYVLAFAGIIIVFLISRLIENSDKDHNAQKSNVRTLIDFIGRNTLVIMCAHVIIKDEMVLMFRGSGAMKGLILRIIVAFVIVIICCGVSRMLDRLGISLLTGKRHTHGD